MRKNTKNLQICFSFSRKTDLNNDESFNKIMDVIEKSEKEDK